MRFDHSALSNALYRMRKNKEKESRKTASKQGNVFVRIAKAVSWEKAPDPAEIVGLLDTLHGRIKRKPGVTPIQEIGRRILKIGTLARNWRFWKVEQSIGSVRVWIRDLTNYSRVVNERQRLTSIAISRARPKLKKANEGLCKKVVGDFNRGTS
jgi:hypothetical protein